MYLPYLLHGIYSLTSKKLFRFLLNNNNGHPAFNIEAIKLVS